MKQKQQLPQSANRQQRRLAQAQHLNQLTLGFYETAEAGVTVSRQQQRDSNQLTLGFFEAAEAGVAGRSS